MPTTTHQLTDSFTFHPVIQQPTNQTQLPTTTEDRQQHDHHKRDTTSEDKSITQPASTSHLMYLYDPHLQHDILLITPHLQQMLSVDNHYTAPTLKIQC
jgi:hypothetical protein